MYPKVCSACGSVVGASTDPLAFDVRGEPVSVPGIEHGACMECGEVYLSLDAAQELQIEAIRLSKAAKGLLAPDEIRAIRHSLSLSQSAFENLLGVGSKTVVRWEKGTVFQSATADRLMRLLRLEPDLAMILKGEQLNEAYTEGPPAAKKPDQPTTPQSVAAAVDFRGRR